MTYLNKQKSMMRRIQYDGFNINYRQISISISINFFTRAMLTKYVESEVRMMSLVLIEGIAEVKRL